MRHKLRGCAMRSLRCPHQCPLALSRRRMAKIQIHRGVFKPVRQHWSARLPMGRLAFLLTSTLSAPSWTQQPIVQVKGWLSCQWWWRPTPGHGDAKPPRSGYGWVMRSRWCPASPLAFPASPACPPGRVFEASGLRFWRWLRGHSAQCSRRLLDGDRYSGWSRTGPRARGRPGAGRSPLQGTDIALPSKERHGLSSLSPLSSPRPIARSPRQTANTEIR